MSREGKISLWSSVACHAMVFCALRFLPSPSIALSAAPAEIPLTITLIPADPTPVPEAPPTPIPAPTVALSKEEPVRHSQEPAPPPDLSVPASTPPPSPPETPRPSAPTQPVAAQTLAIENPVVEQPGNSTAPGSSVTATARNTEDRALVSSGTSPQPRAPQVLAHPNYRKNPTPTYPASAKRRRQEGVVLLKVRVTEEGKPDAVRVSHPSGFAALDEAAVASVRGWEFEPARLDAHPVASEIEVPVRFQLTP